MSRRKYSLPTGVNEEVLVETLAPEDWILQGETWVRVMEVHKHSFKCGLNVRKKEHLFLLKLSRVGETKMSPQALVTKRVKK